MAKTKKVNWGIISTADIGVKKVIPAMQQGELCSISAIASRNEKSAQAAAEKLGIPKAYSSYEQLLEDPEIEAVYIPLPNHMHLPWIRASIHAGKHVLCEKPIVLDPSEIDELQDLQRSSGLLIGEAFMVLHHPRWKRMKELVNSEDIGELRAVSGFFSYFNRDAKNIRNIQDFGGGSIYDIGCYPVLISRYLFGSEPLGVSAVLEFDQEFKIDRLASVLMEFPTGHAMFTASTQLTPYQIIQAFGTRKKYEVPIPFNTPNDRPTQILSHSSDALEPDAVEETFDVCDHYMLQGDAFSRSIREGVPFAGSLENARGNARVLEAVFASAKSRSWVKV